MKKYDCSICNEVMKACKKKGNEKSCAKLIDKLNAGKISEKDFLKKIRKKVPKGFFK